MNPSPYALLCRHPNLFSQQLLVVGMGDNQPAEWLHAMKAHQCSFMTWDWMTHQAATQQLGEHCHFGVPEYNRLPQQSAQQDRVLLWPKSRQLGLILTQILRHSARSLWIIGANDNGGKSIGNACKKIGLSATKTDSARHCSMWQVDTTQADDDHSVEWQAHAKHFQAGQLELTTLPGVFSHGTLDKGTQLLLYTMEQHKLKSQARRILDLGCGTGVIGLTLKHRFETAHVTLADTDALSLECCRINIQHNHLDDTDIDIVASDKLSGINGRYSLIVTNPPFHTGSQTDYRFAESLFTNAKKHLDGRGELWLVANRHLAYEEWARAGFGHIEILAQASGFKILRLHSPKR